jgi:hypothetical protein
MYNPEKLSTYGTQTEEKQNTRQYVFFMYFELMQDIKLIFLSLIVKLDHGHGVRRVGRYQ